MFKVMVLADRSGHFAGNSLVFEDIPEAIAYAIDLMSRWTLVTDWQIVDTQTEEIVMTRDQHYLNDHFQLIHINKQ